MRTSLSGGLDLWSIALRNWVIGLLVFLFKIVDKDEDIINAVEGMI